MTISSLIKQLEEIKEENGGWDAEIHVIFNGKIDKEPSINVDDNVVYIEGSDYE